MLKEIRWYLETALFFTVSFVIALVPSGVALAFGAWLGRLFFILVPYRRQIAIDNITACLPYLQRQPGWPGGTPESIARETFENLGRCVAEICKIYHGKGDSLIDAVEFRGIENYERAFAKGKGVAFITAHCGNWELLALSFGVRYHELSVLARRLDNRHLNAVIERVRQGFGNGVIYKEGALRAMLSAFKRQQIVGMLIDQAVHPNDGVLIDFIGRPAWSTKMPAFVARKSGAPLLPAFIHREGNKQIVTVHPEYVPVEAADPEVCAAEDAAGLARYIEDYVIQHPSQWYWIHKRWKRAPAPETSAAGATVDHDAGEQACG
jgi:Kdo2-lipid IVA lauroyltransferase/acyltransferase